MTYPMLRIAACLSVILLLLGLLAVSPEPTPPAPPERKVHDLLRQLGAPERADVQPRPVRGADVELGRKIVLEGILSDDRRQSKHFVCTSCHNVVPEDPDLTNYDPNARLAYARQQDLPYLPGTTLYGAINRVSYYNGDYDKKYGDLVKPARKDLRAAIQLCATECAQGRPLIAVEMESVLLYLHEISLKVGDLKLTETEDTYLAEALAGRADSAIARRMLTEKYAPFSPATFVLPPKDRKAGYPAAADVETGGEILRRACMHCHGEQRYSFYDISETSDSYAHLLRHFPRYTRYSTYQVSRYGTSPIPGKRAYMPHYTAERMTDGQIESLRSYLEAQLEKSR